MVVDQVSTGVKSDESPTLLSIRVAIAWGATRIELPPDKFLEYVRLAGNLYGREWKDNAIISGCYMVDECRISKSHRYDMPDREELNPLVAVRIAEIYGATKIEMRPECYRALLDCLDAHQCYAAPDREQRLTISGCRIVLVEE